MRSRYYCLTGVLLVGLALALQPLARAAQEPLLPPDVAASVSFNLYRGYLILAPGSAGPLKNLNFLLDTGASSTILDSRLALKLGLDEQPASVVVLDGKVRAGKSQVPSLEFGPLRRHNFPVSIEDLSFLEKALSVRVDAVIGLDLLGRSAFVVDYTSREIRFGPTPQLPISIPLRVEEGLAIIDAQMNHASVHLLVDTGASSLMIFETRMPRSLSGLETGAVKHSSNLNGDFERKQVWLHGFKLGDAEFGQEPAFVVHDRSDAGRYFDGLLSPAALGITRVSVDLDRGVLGFSR
jgi:predicted aspartyl protease